SPAVVAVRVRVDDLPRRFLPHARVAGDQLARVGEIPEGIDHEPSGSVHESGVAAAEAAIFLKAGVDVFGDLPELHRGLLSTTEDLLVVARVARELDDPVTAARPRGAEALEDCPRELGPTHSLGGPHDVDLGVRPA